MRVKLVKEMLAGGRVEWSLEFETSKHEAWRDMLDRAADLERYRATVEAMAAAPDEAEAICREVL